MARQTSDREDLLREATALVERVELNIPTFPDAIVVGFRRDGAASFFFGADPVYQFNARKELRRAFVGGLLLKAERGRLITLRRERTASEVALVRGEPTGERQVEVLQKMQAAMASLRDALHLATFTLIGQSPAETDVVLRIRAWLAECGELTRIADRPNVA